MQYNFYVLIVPGGIDEPPQLTNCIRLSSESFLFKNTNNYKANYETISSYLRCEFHLFLVSNSSLSL